MEPLKHPEGSVELQVATLGQLAAPGIIDDDSGADLRCLHDCLGLAPIFTALPLSLRQKEINGSLIVAVATMEEGVGLEDGSHAILGDSTFEEVLPDRLGQQDF